MFSGVGGYQLSIPDPATTAPELLAAVRRSSIFAHTEHRRLCVQQMRDGSSSVYALMKRDAEDWGQRCSYDSRNLAQVKAALSDGEDSPSADWDPLLKMATSEVEGKCVLRTLYQLPTGFRWEHRSGVAPIGDAAHLMTSSAGEWLTKLWISEKDTPGSVLASVAAACQL